MAGRHRGLRGVNLQRRGAVLFWAGLSWLAQSVGIVMGGWSPWPAFWGTPEAETVWRHSVAASGALWATCGLIAIVSAVGRRRWEWMDRFGFMAVVAPAMFTGVLWLGKLARVTIYTVWGPGASGQYIAGTVVAAVIWIAAAGVYATVAGWREPVVPNLGAGARHRGRRCL